MPSSTPLRNQEYTVGWICALPLEMAAATAMLDEPHGRPQEQHKSDQNTYYLGSIGKHNIVIACLPAGVYGTTSAATVAAQMLFSFESIRIGLMVGIGGGVPSTERDIRLGDVAVGKPGKTLGGVVQYDIGKTIKGGRFTRTGLLNKPPQILLSAVAGLEADHMVEESRIPQFLSEMLITHPTMLAKFSYQGVLNDQLYKADYDHVGEGNTCESCDVSKVIDRPQRSNNAPLIHYGIIASGNQVIRHGVARDRFREEHDIICFEMEAAGLVDNFPCLVIRGICDYADSHKNKRWQNYAAATAAAYAKELLRIIPASRVEATPPAAEVIKTGLSIFSFYTYYYMPL
jgi:nucleoside phosphorylase